LKGAFLALLILILGVHPGQAQSTPPPDTTPLSFHAVPAGVSIAALNSMLRDRGDKPARCVVSRSDPRVQECRGIMADSASRAPLELWSSVIDSLIAIITFKREGSSALLEDWRGDLQRRYGPVPTRVQGGQRMMQWVRRGRMIRLTWRREAPGYTMSVSLVDGRVLDGWGRDRPAKTPG
jgi:hypothetical protein